MNYNKTRTAKDSTYRFYDGTVEIRRCRVCRIPFTMGDETLPPLSFGVTSCGCDYCMHCALRYIYPGDKTPKMCKCKSGVVKSWTPDAGHANCQTQICPYVHDSPHLTAIQKEMNESKPPADVYASIVFSEQNKPAQMVHIPALDETEQPPREVTEGLAQLFEIIGVYLQEIERRERQSAVHIAPIATGNIAEVI